MSENPWPQKGARLFTDGGNYHEFAHFGWGGLSRQFTGYMEGYKNAADSLIDEAIQSADIAKLDTFVYPILFLYRQYLELQLKWIVLTYSGLGLSDKKAFIKNGGHDLLKIWDKTKELFNEYFTPETRQDIQTVEHYLTQFDTFDRSSFTFRYPISKDLESVVGKEHRLNLSNLRQRMQELYSFFVGAESHVSHLQDLERDLADFFAP